MGLPLDAVKSILKLFEKRNFIKIVKKDNQTLYQYTKKADEFGEAFYPLLIWALKYTCV
jgi:predicted transcriptional regulator